jgi:hypothetical protein
MSNAQATKGDDMELNGMTSANRAPLTPQEVNRWNQEFWLVESQLRDRRMSDELLLNFAQEDMRSERAREVSIKSQKTFEQALSDAEKLRNTVRSAFSRKGGSAPRCDALQSLIEEIVRENPKITQGQLLRELKGARGAGTVVPDEKVDRVPDAEKWIHFVNEDRKPKEASVSGLKDRLSRAKRKIASR